MLALTENFTTACGVADLSGVLIFCVKHIRREKVTLIADVCSLVRSEVTFYVSSIDCSKALLAYRVIGPIAVFPMGKLLAL